MLFLLSPPPPPLLPLLLFDIAAVVVVDVVVIVAAAFIWAQYSMYAAAVNASIPVCIQRHCVCYWFLCRSCVLVMPMALHRYTLLAAISWSMYHCRCCCWSCCYCVTTCVYFVRTDFFSFGVYKLLWDLPCISNETAAAKYFVWNIDVKTWRSPACDPISTDPILMHCGVCFFLFRAKNFSSINHPLDISSLVYVLLSPHPFRIVIVWLAKSSGRKLVTALTAVFLQTHNSFRTQM